MNDFVTANGVRLHYRQEGAGDDVLLLCGLGDDLTAWDAQVERFARTHRVTVIDNRGVGRSGLPDGAFTVADLAADAAALRDAIGITRTHVTDFSMGGAIAQELYSSAVYADGRIDAWTSIRRISRRRASLRHLQAAPRHGFGSFASLHDPSPRRCALVGKAFGEGSTRPCRPCRPS